MRKTLYISALLAVISSVSAIAEEPVAATTDIEPQAEQTALTEDLGYFFGYSFGNMLKDGGASDVDIDSLLKGLKDSLGDIAPDLTADQRDRIYQEVRARQAAAQSAQEQAAANQADVNLATANQFLAKNGERPEVTTTATGLQYEVIEEAPGTNAGLDSQVVVNYKGTFISGEVFDQSTDAPAEFGLRQVIPGWTEALQLMSPGDKYRIFVPPGLAYGAGGVGSIPPNSLLIFEVELLSIK